MIVEKVIFVIWIGMCLGLGCCGCSSRDKQIHTVSLVRALSECIDELNEADRIALIRELRAVDQKCPNGSNQALLNFLNNRSKLGDAFLVGCGDIGSVLLNGRLEFHDEWGRPLIIASSDAQRILVSFGKESFEVTVPDVDGHDVLIWSVGLDGVNQSGDHDDLSNWFFAQNVQRHP